MQDVYYVPDLKNNILSIGCLIEKGFSVYMKDRMLYLKDKSGIMLARVEMTNNRMFKLNLKINTNSLRREWKVKDEEVLKMFKALEVQTVETEAAKNKAKFVVHMLKDGLVNPPIDEESDAVVLKEENISAATSRNKGKIKETRHANLRDSTEINNASTSCMIWSNNKQSLNAKKSTSSEKFSKIMKVRNIIGYGFSIGHSMNMPNLLIGNNSNSLIT